MPARLAPDQSRGYLVPLGASVRGAGQTGIFRRLFAILGQRPRVTIVVASADETLADDLDARLVADGAAGHVQRIVLTQRADSEAQAALAAIEHSHLAVLCAEQPLRLSTLLGGTALARLLRRRNADGMAVGGIGAGASVLPEHMLGGGAQGSSPRMGNVSLAPGLGLTNRLLIDQGGAGADRLGRLLGALALNPFVLGIGLDADTAAFIGPDNVLEVVGVGSVTVVDPTDVGHSNAADAGPSDPISITNLRVHVLVHGSRYDLDFRRPL
ncbi:MAG: cyanophycinase [Xanthomonadaceae bacterium]|nr:cyanophycinase [Xanthomonadaceae bacterium]MDE1885499.1 cyanophycinase [Xanthomonadaceae bacterium]MDE1961374.1 cyanophycinase [Xanthomonadaceae bacterium]MDE2084595.1 cyanophycinase [Xanthomonadaceae bacterium]MDE2256695.1 cyanophycinase [Xanthomonadaceae bacterium]